MIRGCLPIPLTLAAVLYDPESYNFGENWESYVRDLKCAPGDELVNSLIASLGSLVRFLAPRGDFIAIDEFGRRVLHNLSFMDIGCGSGIHSGAALLADAKEVLSFDQQEGSVRSTTIVRNRFFQFLEHFDDRKWDIFLGDVLNQSDLPDRHADVVYSWGALHHTGDLWTALRNSCGLVNTAEEGGGLLMIALYAREMVRDPDYWIYVKQRYLAVSDEHERGKMEKDYGWWLLKDQAQKGSNPFQMVEEARLQRGMNFWTDVKDWLGGYPTEFSEASEVIQLLKKHCGLVPARVRPSTVTEFLFVTDPEAFVSEDQDWICYDLLLEKRSALVRDWHQELLNHTNKVRLKGPFQQLDYPGRKACYFGDLPIEAEDLSTLRFDVLEDDELYGFGVETDIPVDSKGFRKLTSLYKTFAEEDFQAANPTQEWQARFGADGLSCNHPGRHFREVFWRDPMGPQVIFSSSDGSDPNSNDREYSVVVQEGTGIPKPQTQHVAAASLYW